MAANQPDQPPSGPGQAKLLAQQTAAGLAAGETVTMAVKTATLPQLTSIMAFGCAKGGFPTLNRHLYLDQLHGLGWQDLQPLLDDPAKGREALQTSLDTLRYFGAGKKYTGEYQRIFEKALNGEAVDLLDDSRRGGVVPQYLAYEHIKVPVPRPGGRRQREHKILIYCWRRELDFPDAPVFHAQPVKTPQSQYGALNVPPKSIFPEAFSTELANTDNLKLHIVSAVYGAKREWAVEHYGEEPPPHVVDTWSGLQASHRLEGPISLRRNWNPRFLTLESEWDNKLRHACTAAVLKKLVSEILPPDASAVLRQHLEESQATGSQPQPGEFSLVEGNQLLLSQMFADLEEAEIEDFIAEINEHICSKLHPLTPCKFWDKSYGAVPDAVSTVPINDSILYKQHLVWPPGPELAGPSEEPPAKRVVKPFDWRVPKTVHQAKEKLLFVDIETAAAQRAADAAGESRTRHKELNKWRQRKYAVKGVLEKLQKKEAAWGYAVDDP
ncbi:g2837 [Coccomyxa elongata]